MSFRTQFLMMIFFCFSLQAMKRDWQLANLDYKQRDTNCLHHCFPKKDEKLYPCFLSDKKDPYAQRSLRDELLVAKRVLKKEMLKEVSSLILHKSYLITQQEDRLLIKKYKKAFNKDKEGCDLLYLNQLHKQTLLYVLKDEFQKKNEIRVEGRDKEFAQKMSENILSLPLPIKENIINKFGLEIISNINYKPSWRDIVLDDEDNKKRCKVLTSAECCTVSYCMLHGSKILSSYKPVKFSIALLSVMLTRVTGLSDSAIREYLFSGIDYGTPIALSACCCGGTYKALEYLLQETQEQKDARHGFANIPLKEMESVIIDQ